MRMASTQIRFAFRTYAGARFQRRHRRLFRSGNVTECNSQRRLLRAENNENALR